MRQTMSRAHPVQHAYAMYASLEWLSLDCDALVILRPPASQPSDPSHNLDQIRLLLGNDRYIHQPSLAHRVGNKVSRQRLAGDTVGIRSISSVI